MLRRQLKRQRVVSGPQQTPPSTQQDTAAAVPTGEDEEDDWGDCADLVDDTLAAIQLLTSRSAAGFAAIDLPPLVLWHQLYTVFPNRTFIDQNIHRLRNEGALVTFRVPTGTDEIALIPKAAYVAELEKWLRLLRNQRELHQRNQPSTGSEVDSKSIVSKHDALARFTRVLPSISQLPSIPLRVLVEELQRRQSQSATSSSPAATSNNSQRVAADQSFRDDIVWLQRLGFLRQVARLDDEIFHLSVPGIGKLVSAVKKTRVALLSTLKRTKYKEAAEKQLKKTKLKHSRFDWDYHLADMEGLGLLRRTKVTSGILVALAER